MKRKSNYIDCCTMLTEDVAKIIIALHVISSRDHTSSFYGHGEKKLLEKVVSDHEEKETLCLINSNGIVKTTAVMKTLVLTQMTNQQTPTRISGHVF